MWYAILQPKRTINSRLTFECLISILSNVPWKKFIELFTKIGSCRHIISSKRRIRNISDKVTRSSSPFELYASWPQWSGTEGIMKQFERNIRSSCIVRVSLFSFLNREWFSGFVTICSEVWWLNWGQWYRVFRLDEVLWPCCLDGSCLSKRRQYWQQRKPSVWPPSWGPDRLVSFRCQRIWVTWSYKVHRELE